MGIVIRKQQRILELMRNLVLFFFLLSCYRDGKEPKGITRDEVIYARKLYESAFHPDSGELQNVFGRMSFQVPGGMLLTGAMLQFYR